MKIPSHFEQRFLDFLGHCVNFSLSVLCGNDFHLMLSNVYTQISTMYCTVDVLNQVFVNTSYSVGGLTTITLLVYREITQCEKKGIAFQ
jgi:hypothetical protein